MGQDEKKDTPELVSVLRGIADRPDVLGGTKGRLIRIQPLPPAPEPTPEAGLAAERVTNDLQAEVQAELPPEPEPKPEPEPEPEAEQAEQVGWAVQDAMNRLRERFPPHGLPPAGMSTLERCRQIGLDPKKRHTVSRAIARLHALKE